MTNPTNPAPADALTEAGITDEMIEQALTAARPAVRRPNPEREAALVAAAAQLPPQTFEQSTPWLEDGMVVRFYGLRLRLHGKRETGHPSGATAFDTTCIGLAPGWAPESIDSILISDIAHRGWTIQGNELALWTVER